MLTKGRTLIIFFLSINIYILIRYNDHRYINNIKRSNLHQYIRKLRYVFPNLDNWIPPLSEMNLPRELGTVPPFIKPNLTFLGGCFTAYTPRLCITTRRQICISTITCFTTTPIICNQSTPTTKSTTTETTETTDTSETPETTETTEEEETETIGPSTLPLCSESTTIPTCCDTLPTCPKYYKLVCFNTTSTSTTTSTTNTTATTNTTSTTIVETVDRDNKTANGTLRSLTIQSKNLNCVPEGKIKFTKRKMFCCQSTTKNVDCVVPKFSAVKKKIFCCKDNIKFSTISNSLSSGLNTLLTTGVDAISSTTSQITLARLSVTMRTMYPRNLNRNIKRAKIFNKNSIIGKKRASSSKEKTVFEV
ncbi:hypothetical protein CHUAL_001956 [Chamberlinius hualienensis]